MSSAKLHDFEITRVAAQALKRMKAATRARVQAGLIAPGYSSDAPALPRSGA